ncbi:MAG: hypothetical protein E7641_03625 [Ruminococcaceae bacterium]|nr:hypothetical protein [Oscillospiraceae bacterium]
MTSIKKILAGIATSYFPLLILCVLLQNMIGISSGIPFIAELLGVLMISFPTYLASVGIAIILIRFINKELRSAIEFILHILLIIILVISIVLTFVDFADMIFCIYGLILTAIVIFTVDFIIYKRKCEISSLFSAKSFYITVLVSVLVGCLIICSVIMIGNAKNKSIDNDDSRAISAIEYNIESQYNLDSFDLTRISISSSEKKYQIYVVGVYINDKGYYEEWDTSYDITNEEYDILYEVNNSNTVYNSYATSSHPTIYTDFSAEAYLILNKKTTVR